MIKPSVFISYSHKDEDWKDRLVTHLGVLEREDILELWEDRRIEAGDDWKPEIEKAIDKATVAILMISANFLTSKFILGEEVPKLLERREKKGLRIIPLIVKPCIWTRAKWLSPIQARPKDGRALSGGTENQIDTDLSVLTDEIARLIENIEALPEDNYSPTNQLDSLITGAAELNRVKVHSLGQRVKDLITFGDYEKARNACSDFLDYNSAEPLINLLIVIATLKEKGADRYQTKTIKRLEKNLSNACDDPEYYPTALVIWALIKHDHYKLNALSQGKPTLDEIKDSLTKIDLEEIDLDLVRKIKASHRSYEYFNLLRLYQG